MNGYEIEAIMSKIQNVIEDDELRDYEFLLHIKEIAKEIK
jgi:hypothetical protein